MSNAVILSKLLEKAVSFALAEGLEEEFDASLAELMQMVEKAA